MTNLPPNPTLRDLDSLELLDRDELIKMLRSLTKQGVTFSFHGKRTASEIYKRVRPRVMRSIKALSVGSAEDQRRNLIVEGENLQYRTSCP